METIVLFFCGKNTVNATVAIIYNILIIDISYKIITIIWILIRIVMVQWRILLGQRGGDIFHRVIFNH